MRACYLLMTKPILMILNSIFYAIYIIEIKMRLIKGLYGKDL